METRDRDTLAALLRKAALQTISEPGFWTELGSLTDSPSEPILKLATASAKRYWQLFQGKKKFMQKPARPDAAQLRQAIDELNLIAAVLETGWQLPVFPDIGHEGA